MTYAINHATSVSASSCFDRNSSFNINGVRIAVNKGNSLQNIISRINSVSSRTGVSAKLTRSGEITLTSKNNKPIKIQDKFGVLFGLGSKNSKGTSTIPKLSDELIGVSAKNNNVVYLKNNNTVKKNSAEIGIQANSEENNAVAVRQNSEKARNVFPTKSFLMGVFCKKYMMSAMYNKYMMQSYSISTARKAYGEAASMMKNPFLYKLQNPDKFKKIMDYCKINQKI